MTRITDEQRHFLGVARLAGERDDLATRLAHVEGLLDQAVRRAHDDGVSAAALADTAGVGRQGVYAAVARATFASLPITAA